jgi:hypothetical protein
MAAGLKISRPQLSTRSHVDFHVDGHVHLPPSPSRHPTPTSPHPFCLRQPAHEYSPADRHRHRHRRRRRRRHRYRRDNEESPRTETLIPDTASHQPTSPSTDLFSSAPAAYCTHVLIPVPVFVPSQNAIHGRSPRTFSHLHNECV